MSLIEINVQIIVLISMLIMKLIHVLSVVPIKINVFIIVLLNVLSMCLINL